VLELLELYLIDAARPRRGIHDSSERPRAIQIWRRQHTIGLIFKKRMSKDYNSPACWPVQTGIERAEGFARIGSDGGARRARECRDSRPAFQAAREGARANAGSPSQHKDELLKSPCAEKRARSIRARGRVRDRAAREV
jgi:hypothetical protein